MRATGSLGKLDRESGVLLGYQKRWNKDKSPVKLIEKSRRIGLTWGGAADDVLFSASASGDDTWYLGYNKDMAKEYIKDCATWAKHFNQAASAIEESLFRDEDKDILTFTTHFSSGHSITALASTPTNLRGKQGRVKIDEAAFHPNLRELLKAALALTIWGGTVEIISTHDGVDNEFNLLIEEIRAGKKPYSLHRVTLDDALHDGFYRRVCEKLKRPWSQESEEAWRADLVQTYGDGADEELFCIPSQGSGNYLSRVVIERCMADDIPVVRYRQTDTFTLLPDLVREAEVRDWCERELMPLLARLDARMAHYFGEDFARSCDLTVIYPLAESTRLTYRAPFVVELANVPFKEQEQILKYILDRLPRFTAGCMDARGNGQYLAERARQQYGERVQAVMLSESWYREEMPRFKSFFEDGTLTVPRDSEHMDDFRAVKMIKGVAKVPDERTASTSGGKRHGDAAIALAMAVSATRREVEEYAVHKVDPRENNDLHRAVRTRVGFKRSGVF